MKSLEKSFVSGMAGFGANPKTYTQLIRNRLFAIYERKNSDGIVNCYEVIKIQIIKKGTRIPQFNKTYEDDQENYPGSNSWGVNGFTYTDLKLAKKKFDELTKNFEKDYGKL